jgi:hypothetical protein
VTPDSEQYSPSNDTGPPLNSLRITSRPSSILRNRVAGSTPAASNSAGYSPPAPSPSSKRPSEMLSIIAASFATTTAGYNGSNAIDVTSRIRVVTAAAAASIANAFGVGPWKNKCSPQPTRSNPSSSARWASPATVRGSSMAMPTLNGCAPNHDWIFSRHRIS